jgi:hypothetical protein
MEHFSRHNDDACVRLGSRWHFRGYRLASGPIVVRVEEFDVAMDSVTVRWPERRERMAAWYTSIGLCLEDGDMVQAIEDESRRGDGVVMEAGDVGVVTRFDLNVTGSNLFFNDECVYITWLGTGHSTTYKIPAPLFEKFKRVGYRSTTCMSLTHFLQVSTKLPFCSECDAQFETEGQVQQHTDSVHRGQEHQYRKPKTKRERMEVHHLRTIPTVLTIHHVQVDPSQFSLVFLSLSGTRFFPCLHMPASETVSGLITAIEGRPEFALPGGHRRHARILLQDGRELHECDRQSLLGNLFDSAPK